MNTSITFVVFAICMSLASAHINLFRLRRASSQPISRSGIGHVSRREEEVKYVSRKQPVSRLAPFHCISPSLFLLPPHRRSVFRELAEFLDLSLSMAVEPLDMSMAIERLDMSMPYGILSLSMPPYPLVPRTPSGVPAPTAPQPSPITAPTPSVTPTGNDNGPDPTPTAATAPTPTLGVAPSSTTAAPSPGLLGTALPPTDRAAPPTGDDTDAGVAGVQGDPSSSSNGMPPVQMAAIVLVAAAAMVVGLTIWRRRVAAQSASASVGSGSGI